MKNTRKLVSLCMAAVLIISCLLASCGNENTDAESSSADVPTYVFTVVCGDTGKPVSGVQVQLCKGDSYCLMPVDTDENGVANYVLSGSNDYDVYDIHIIGGIPEGYTFDNASLKTDATAHTYTLTLNPSESGEVSDVSSDETSGTKQEQSDSTSEDGNTSSEDENTSSEDDSTSSETGSDPEISEDEVSESTECEHTFVNGKCIKCGISESYEYSVKTAYDSSFTDKSGVKHEKGDPIANVSLVITDESGSTIVAMGTTDSSGVFTFNAPKYTVVDNGVVTGYYIRVTGGIPEGLTIDTVQVFYGDSRTATIGFYEKIELSGAREAYDPSFLKEGVTYRETLAVAKEDSDLSQEDESYYYYAFRPQSFSEEGLYRVSVKNVSGNATVDIIRLAASAAYVNPYRYEQCEGTSPYIEFMIEKKYLMDSNGDFAGQNYWLFGVKVTDSNAVYPVKLDLTIEKVRDLVPGKDYPIEVRHILTLAEGTPSADSITGTVSGTLTAASLSATLVKDSNGYYHIGSVDGPYAMVTLTAPNRMLNNDKDVNFCNVNDMSGTEQVCLSELIEENGIKTLHYYMYYQLLNQYGALCNKDGAYVVNDELLTFLKGYAAQRLLDNRTYAHMLGITYYK